MRKILILISFLLLLSSCIGSSTFRAYEGEARSALQVSLVEGAQYLRQDWLNRYFDSVRFSRVNDTPIDANIKFNSIELTPGDHDLTVYFYWDLGSQRGLASALMSYAAAQDTFSRTLRLNAKAGETYIVQAQPVFNEGRRGITNLSHVDFWIEDENGNEIVSRDEGRYRPQVNSGS